VLQVTVTVYVPVVQRPLTPAWNVSLNAPLAEIVFESAKTRLPAGFLMIIPTETVRDDPPVTVPETTPFWVFE